MAKLLLVPSAQTDWRVQQRIAGDTDLPLNEAGLREAVSCGQVLASFNPTIVYCGPEDAAKQTAGLIAHELRVRSRAVDALREVHLGHWQGLSEQEFEDRFERVARAWRSEPRSVSPPDGQSLDEAETRLLEGLFKIVKRRRGETLVVVLGPLACGIVRCRFAPDGFERFWEFVEEPMTHHELDVQPAELQRPRADETRPAAENSDNS